MLKPLLIGQAPGPNTDPTLPLYPLPRSATGGRLAEFAGLSHKRYLDTFDRINLLYEFPGRWKRDDKWPVREARIAAQAIRPLLRDRTVVFIGRNVAESFGYGSNLLPFHVWYTDPKFKFQCACVPHPSGRNHWYHRESNRMESQEFWEIFMREHQIYQVIHNFTS